MRAAVPRLSADGTNECPYMSGKRSVVRQTSSRVDMIAMQNHVLPILGSSEPWPLLDSPGAVQAYHDTRDTDGLQESTGRKNTLIG